LNRHQKLFIPLVLMVVAAYGSWRVYAAASSFKAPALSTPASEASFRLALPGFKHVFPRDHAAHPEYSTEWWYYTGHLQTSNGRRFGYELTFFRQALTPKAVQRASKWATRDIIFAHFAVTDERGQRFYPADRIARAAAGVAGAQTNTPHVWIGDWDVRFRGHEQTLRAAARSKDGTHLGIELTQTAEKPPVIHGINGVSQKAAGRGQASHYYSFTRLSTRGTLRLGNERFAVVGQSWFDHEFGSNQLAPGQVGWDWFSLQLDDGRELMLYRMRLRNGGTDPFSSGTMVERNGRTRHLKVNDYRIEPLATWRSADTKATYPTRWRLSLPRENISLEVAATLPNQEFVARQSIGISYWEGSVRVLGTQRGKPIQGKGYVELTGYDKPFSKTF
jgi:predicted secreted hydrolase